MANLSIANLHASVSQTLESYAPNSWAGLSGDQEDLAIYYTNLAINCKSNISLGQDPTRRSLAKIEKFFIEASADARNCADTIGQEIFNIAAGLINYELSN